MDKKSTNKKLKNNFNSPSRDDQQKVTLQEELSNLRKTYVGIDTGPQTLEDTLLDGMRHVDDEKLISAISKYEEYSSDISIESFSAGMTIALYNAIRINSTNTVDYILDNYSENIQTSQEKYDEQNRYRFFSRAINDKNIGIIDKIIDTCHKDIPDTNYASALYEGVKTGQSATLEHMLNKHGDKLNDKVVCWAMTATMLNPNLPILKMLIEDRFDNLSYTFLRKFKNSLKFAKKDFKRIKPKEAYRYDALIKYVKEAQAHKLKQNIKSKFKKAPFKPKN